MKSVKILALVCSAVLLFAACGDNGCDPKPEISKTNEYIGDVWVTQSDSSLFMKADVTVDYEITDTAGLVLTFYQIQFSSKMPVSIDMVVPNVLYEGDDEIIISGENIVPLAMGGEFPQYTITNLHGTINDSNISLSMNCGSNPFEYSGTSK